MRVWLNFSPQSQSDRVRSRKRDRRVFDKCHFSHSFKSDASGVA